MMIKKNKKQLIISSIIILLPVIAGLFMRGVLPGRITIHWSLNGEADGWSDRVFAIFALPVILLIAHWVCIFVTFLDPKNKEQSSKVFGMVLWIMPLLSLITSGTTYAIALGTEIDVALVVRILLGLMFVILGNYMPKCKQNHTIGIKVTWTLRNEENWNKTHRFTGRLWVVGGVLLLTTVFVQLDDFYLVFLMLILILAFAPLVYSYFYYRKQLQAGTATKEDAVATSYEKKMTKISIVISIVILVLVGIFLFTGDFEVQFGEESFVIETAYWEDAEISYDEIDAIEYRDSDNPGSRTFGYGSFTLLMGEFENEEFGDYTRYSYEKCDSCIVLTVDDEVLVINGKDDVSTEALYEELTKRVNK